MAKKNQESKEIAVMGSRIKQMRERLHYSQQQLADIAGTTQATISDLENNRVNVGTLLLKQLSIVLDSSTDYFFGLSNDPTEIKDSDLSMEQSLIIAELRTQDVKIAQAVLNLIRAMKNVQ